MGLSAYEQSTQVAFREVADVLASTDTLRPEEVARRALTESSQGAFRLSEARRLTDLDDHLGDLDAQRNVFANESTHIETDTERKISLSTLF